MPCQHGGGSQLQLTSGLTRAGEPLGGVVCLVQCCLTGMLVGLLTLPCQH